MYVLQFYLLKIVCFSIELYFIYNRSSNDSTNSAGCFLFDKILLMPKNISSRTMLKRIDEILNQNVMYFYAVGEFGT
jgi:hypothetical protein